MSEPSPTYMSYLPDSFVHFQEHPEFADVFQAFVAHNVDNNAGDLHRLWSLVLNLKQVIREGISGDFAELGVWKGNTAAVLAHYAAAAKRKLVLFDTFAGFASGDLVGMERSRADLFRDTSIELVKEVIGENVEACDFVTGRFPDVIPDRCRQRTYAAVSLDCDLYEPMKAGLEFFYPRMPQGGILFLHDYSSGHWPGATKAVDEFCARTGEFVTLLPDKSGSAVIRKSKG